MHHSDDCKRSWEESDFDNHDHVLRYVLRVEGTLKPRTIGVARAIVRHLPSVEFRNDPPAARRLAVPAGGGARSFAGHGLARRRSATTRRGSCCLIVAAERCGACSSSSSCAAGSTTSNSSEARRAPAPRNRPSGRARQRNDPPPSCARLRAPSRATVTVDLAPHRVRGPPRLPATRATADVMHRRGWLYGCCAAARRVRASRAFFGGDSVFETRHDGPVVRPRPRAHIVVLGGCGGLSTASSTARTLRRASSLPDLYWGTPRGNRRGLRSRRRMADALNRFDAPAGAADACLTDRQPGQRWSPRRWATCARPRSGSRGTPLIVVISLPLRC